MSGNFAIKGGGARPLMANAILNFHFDFLNPSLIYNTPQVEGFSRALQTRTAWRMEKNALSFIQDSMWLW